MYNYLGDRMKKNILIFLVVGIVVIGLSILLFILNRPNYDEDLVLVKEKMTSLNSYSYDGKFILTMRNKNHDISMKCEEDKTNGLGHCKTNYYDQTIEQYKDYKNKIKYEKKNNAYSWTKTNDNKMSEALPILNYIDKLNVKKKEKYSNGTLYSGNIRGSALSGIISANSRQVGKVPISVFVSDDNTISKLTFVISIKGAKYNAEITFNNYNSSSIRIPGSIK